MSLTVLLYDAESIDANIDVVEWCNKAMASDYLNGKLPYYDTSPGAADDQEFVDAGDFYAANQPTCGIFREMVTATYGGISVVRFLLPALVAISLDCPISPRFDTSSETLNTNL